MKGGKNLPFDVPEDRTKNGRPRGISQGNLDYTPGRVLFPRCTISQTPTAAARGTSFHFYSAIDPTYAPANSLFTGHAEGGIKRRGRCIDSLVTFASLYSWLEGRRRTRLTRARLLTELRCTPLSLHRRLVRLVKKLAQLLKRAFSY